MEITYGKENNLILQIFFCINYCLNVSTENIIWKLNILISTVIVFTYKFTPISWIPWKTVIYKTKIKFTLQSKTSSRSFKNKWQTVETVLKAKSLQGTPADSTIVRSSKLYKLVQLKLQYYNLGCNGVVFATARPLNGCILVEHSLNSAFIKSTPVARESRKLFKDAGFDICLCYLQRYRTKLLPCH